jgi:hypothetical protein
LKRVAIELPHLLLGTSRVDPSDGSARTEPARRAVVVKSN